MFESTKSQANDLNAELHRLITSVKDPAKKREFFDRREPYSGVNLESPSTLERAIEALEQLKKKVKQQLAKEHRIDDLISQLSEERHDEFQLLFDDLLLLQNADEKEAKLEKLQADVEEILARKKSMSEFPGGVI